MAFSKSLLIKGLAAGTALGGVGVAIHQKDNIASLFSKQKISMDKIDLECGKENGSDCTLKTGKKILVKRGEETHLEVNNLGSGKIKLYGAKGYEGNFKFVVEDNDIAGTSDNKKMEELETYEIKFGEKDNSEEALKGQYYLSRKTDAKTEIKNALGLTCDLPANGSSQECTITSKNIGTIRFDGGTATVSGTVTLTISADDSKDEYPLGYRFSFKNTGTGDANLNIGGKTTKLKRNSGVDFKIKKEGSSLSLEKAWTLENLTKKVGLKRTSDGYWDVDVDAESLNVKQDSNKDTERTRNTNQEGKIKVYEEEEGYNEGFRLSIEKGDINLKTKSGSTTKVLGQYETYEISKDEDGKWYLTRKTKNEEKIKSLLGLPCDLPKASNNPVDCQINAGNIGIINFEGGTPSITGTPKLTISVVDERGNYPLGYKFAFTSEGESSITIGSTKTSLKQNLIIDFKIKVSGANKDTLTLEKAFTADDLMDETSFNKSGDAWTVGDKNLNIKQGTNKSSEVTGANPKNAKIRVYEETPGYNQGMKFVVEDGDTNLSGGGMSKLSRYETYEVVKDSTDNNYYFTRKQTSSESVKERLGLPSDCTMPTANNSVDCTLNSEEKLKAIKFEGKGDEEKVSIDGGDSLTLKICNTNNSSDGHGGYKFTLLSDKTVTIPQNGSSDSITINANESTEFKIKESQGKLTLEKKSN